MTNMRIIEVVIGLVFVYLLLALFCTVINEIIARVASLRARNLRRGVQELLADEKFDGLAKRLYDHQLIKRLADEGWTARIIRTLRGFQGGPAYVPSNLFSRALIDTLVTDGNAGADVTEISVASLREAVNKCDNPDVKQVLRTLLNEEGVKLADARRHIALWFDDAMGQVSGWYKRRLQLISYVVALLVVLAVNANSFRLAERLWQDPTLREAMANQASAAVSTCSGSGTDLADCAAWKDHAAIEAELAKLPLGWEPDTSPTGSTSFLKRLSANAADVFASPLNLLGLLATALAVSLGAPFWFDLLNKLNSIRSDAAPPSRE